MCGILFRGSCSVTLSDQRGGAVNTSDERGGAVNTSDERGRAVNTSDQRGGAVNTTASPSRKNKGRVPQHVYQLQLKCPVCMVRRRGAWNGMLSGAY